MSIINRTRKRLFSFSKSSGGQDPLSEEGETQGLDDASMRHLSALSARSGTNSSGGGGGGGAAADEKIKPSSYVFLQIENPFRTWKVIEDYANDDNDNDDHYQIEMVCHSDARDATASCRIITKFSDDAFDDYLFEIGLLNVKYPRFDDCMAEVELIKELNHSNVVKFIDVYYYDARLWVNFFLF